MRVLSLCGGVETGYLALKNLGIPVEEYHTFEILPEAIAVSSYHFPEIIHHGDLYKANWEDFKGFDLVMGGMCCQSLSKVRIEDGSVNNGLVGKSGIVYELQKAIEIIQPKYFFAENVVPSRDEDLQELNRIMGVKGVLINSGLFSAQDRPRYYWTNIPIAPIITNTAFVMKETNEPILTLPTSNSLVIKDIMEHDVDEKYFYNKDFKVIDPNKRVCAELLVNSMEMNKRIYNINYKAPTLTCINGGYHEKKIMDNGRPRKLTEVEYERLQGFPDNFTNVKINGRPISYTKRCSMMGNSWTLPVIEHIFKNL